MTDSYIRYRPNVAAILRRADGKILVCERIDVADAWQFPQGGVNPGESHEEAVIREIEEEISVPPEFVRIVEKRGPYRYLLGGGRTKRGYHGQEQHYFLVDFTGDDSAVNVSTQHQEFSRTRWIDPQEFELGWLPEMKRGVYGAVFRDFFSVSLKTALRD